jgi:hypothetical protein
VVKERAVRVVLKIQRSAAMSRGGREDGPTYAKEGIGDCKRRS